MRFCRLPDAGLGWVWACCKQRLEAVSFKVPKRGHSLVAKHALSYLIRNDVRGLARFDQDLHESCAHRTAVVVHGPASGRPSNFGDVVESHLVPFGKDFDVRNKSSDGEQVLRLSVLYIVYTMDIRNIY